jgi:hypothetical protein
MSTWIQALKIFNKDGMWCMPRKGSPEHAKVLDIMKKIKSGDQKRITDSASSKKALEMETPKRKLRTEKEKKETEMMGMEDRDVGKDELIYAEGKTFNTFGYDNPEMFYLVKRGNKGIRFAEGIPPNYTKKLKKLSEVELLPQDPKFPKRISFMAKRRGFKTEQVIHADYLVAAKTKDEIYITKLTSEYVNKIRKIKEEWGKL